MDKKQCVYAKKCGGCDYQGIDYKEQLAKKQAYMKKLLKPVCHVEPIIGMKDPFITGTRFMRHSTARNGGR